MANPASNSGGNPNDSSPANQPGNTKMGAGTLDENAINTRQDAPGGVSGYGSQAAGTLNRDQEIGKEGGAPGQPVAGQESQKEPQASEEEINEEEIVADPEGARRHGGTKAA